MLLTVIQFGFFKRSGGADQGTPESPWRGNALKGFPSKSVRQDPIQTVLRSEMLNLSLRTYRHCYPELI